MRKKVISVDLDGVLNTYHGNFDKNLIPPPADGALEFLQKLSRDFSVEVFTTRDVKLAEKWLRDNNLARFVEKVSNIKSPQTSVFVDDRAVNFDGDFTAVFEKIQNFRPHWK